MFQLQSSVMLMIANINDSRRRSPFLGPGSASVWSYEFWSATVAVAT